MTIWELIILVLAISSISYNIYTSFKKKNKREEEQNQLLKEIINTLRDIQEGKK